MAGKQRVKTKRKVKKTIGKGIVHISASFNNTSVTVTDDMGNVLCWSTAGALGFKGSRKSTPYAAQQAVEDAMTKAGDFGLKEVSIRVQGPGAGRETAVKAVGATEGIRVISFKDVTPLPHNGCRPPKRRRV
ncbi:MAG: 30S ribosomal protein S11 [Deltaproteobacteria bacterium]|nr:MAG: 30S ribosomal protein S11 [Deltaproteobacteria bacterium]